MKNILSRVKHSYISQPDEITCQAACIAMALNAGPESVAYIRQELVNRGVAGSPAIMGNVLRKNLKDRYIFDVDASMRDIQGYLNDGEFLITHGWFTDSGHVICIDGYQEDPINLSYRINVKDPWGEFDAKNWRYISGISKFDGFYSARLIYSACVKGQSVSDSKRIYARGELDSKLPGAWVHRIKP